MQAYSHITLKHSFLFNHWSWAALSLVSTWMGDRKGISCVVSYVISLASQQWMNMATCLRFLRLQYLFVLIQVVSCQVILPIMPGTCNFFPKRSSVQHDSPSFYTECMATASSSKVSFFMITWPKVVFGLSQLFLCRENVHRNWLTWEHNITLWNAVKYLGEGCTTLPHMHLSSRLHIKNSCKYFESWMHYLFHISQHLYVGIHVK